MKIYRYFSVLLPLLMGVCFVAAQERVISEADYIAYRNKASLVFQSTPYREKRTVEARETADSPWAPYSYTTTEYIKPDRWHTWHTMTALGDRDPKSEVIRIGNTTYSKIPGGSWRIDGYREGTTRSKGDTQKAIIEYKNLDSEIISGQRTTVLQKISISQLNVDGANVEVTLTEKDWFNEQGRILRMEFVTPNEPKKSFRTTMLYEYVPTIKIEAPIR